MGQDELRKMVYIRTAYRNEAVRRELLNRLASPLDGAKVTRLIDNDASVSENYQRMIMQTIDGVYDESIPDATSKGEIRDRFRVSSAKCEALFFLFSRTWN